MKTLLTRTLSLVVCIVAAIAVRWIVINLNPPLVDKNILPGVGAAIALLVFIFCWHFRSHSVPVIFCVELGTSVSWVSIYMFCFAVWVFHSVPAVRACEAMGNFLLLPARGIFELTGADQSAIFFDPISFAGTNGLILGLLFYAAFRMIWNRRESKAR